MSSSRPVYRSGMLRAATAVLTLTAVLLSLCTTVVYAQTPKKKLSGGLNLPTSSQVFPSLNAVEDYMVLLSNYTNSGDYELMYSPRTGMDTWDRAVPIPNLHKPRLDHMGSYCLSHDGRFLLFSSTRSGGVGKYDIWISERRGNAWSTPQNPGKPLNSPGNEGNPSLSPDGNTLYFMRCETMTVNEKSGCRLYRSRRRPGNRWSEPEPLPFNSGHDTTPRILIDNRSLIFASNREGGMGSMDLYLSREEEGGWTDPVALDFLNTPRNDEYVAIPAKGDVVYYTDRDRDQYQIYKAMIPESMRPDPVLLLTGAVTFADSGLPATGSLVQATDSQRARVVSQTRADTPEGGFFMVLGSGASYDLLFAPPGPGYAFAAVNIDLRSAVRPAWEQPNISLPRLDPGLQIPLPALQFGQEEDILPDNAERELGVIARLLQMNPGLSLEVGIADEKFDDLPLDDSEFTVFGVEMPMDTIPSPDQFSGNQLMPDQDQGFTDEEAAGEPLCTRRARAVAAYFIERGLPEERISWRSGCYDSQSGDALLHFTVLE